MTGILLSALADQPIDPATVQPSPLSSLPFVFVGLATLLLILSMLKHLKRARTNFPPDREG
jgi:hypothetical protein